METGIPDGGVTQYDNSSVTAEAGSHQTVIRLEQPKESPWKQPAVYIAILALIVSLGGEWRRWVALDDLRDKQHDYYEEINVYEIDGFNREKDVEELLKQATGIDAIKLLGKPRHPPIPKGN